MLEDTLGSRSKVRILRELVRRSAVELTTDDLVQATGQSTGTLVPSLQQLGATGIVETRLVGKTRVFKLADRHPLAPAVRRLFDDESRAITLMSEGVFRTLPKDGVRFAAWFHDEVGEDRSQTVTLLVIADRPESVDAPLQKALTGNAFLRPKVLAVPAMRSALASGNREYVRMIERARVLFADQQWLKSG